VGLATRIHTDYRDSLSHSEPCSPGWVHGEDLSRTC
jgi:hypothetical protein